MSYEVHFQLADTQYTVRGPDIDGVLALIQGVQGTEVIPEHEARRDAAEATLRGLKYEWRGGEKWVPPIGQPPPWVNEPAEAPWYPDDSGDWVEGHPRDLPPTTDIADWLYRDERERRNYCPSACSESADYLSMMSHVVAYKVVKP